MKKTISAVAVNSALSQLFILLALLIGPIIATAAKKNICTITANSKDEKEVFQSKLDPQDFNFIELTDFSSDKAKKNNDWFQNACEKKVECDVLIVSGHFGGSFYGDSGFSLSLGDLEKNSCQSKCHGILEKPKEVYLFGCNTLASKEKDHRTPEDYYRALVEHDVSPVEAERIVAARYSPLGTSNQDRMQRIFEGVPMIYGFSSVGPSGKHVRPSLIKYLTEIGDYKKHLESIENGYTENKTFLQNMTAYATRITTGMKNDSVNSEVKSNSCKLNDHTISREVRVSHASQVLEKSPYVYFPVVSHFIRENFQTDALWDNESTNIETQELIRLTSNIDLKEKVLKIYQAGGLGPALQMDMLSFARTVRWINREEFEKQTKTLITDLISKSTIQNVDLLCSLTSEFSNLLYHIDIRLEDIPANFDYSSKNAPRLLSCLETKDDRITAKALGSIQTPNFNQLSVTDKALIIHGLSSLPGYEDEMVHILQTLPPYSGQYAKDYSKLIKKVILKKIKGPQQAGYLKAILQEFHDDLESLFYYLEENKNLTEETETIYLHQSANLYLANPNLRYNLLKAFSGRANVQDWVTKYIPSNYESARFYNTLFGTMTFEIHKPTPLMIDQLMIHLEKSLSSNVEFEYTNISLLNRAHLSETQVRKLVQIYQKSNIPKKDFIRPVLKKYRTQHPFLREVDLSGPMREYQCTKMQRNNHSTSSCQEKYLGE